MDKVLILTYYWPPSGGAGVQRWLKFVKYMRDFNYEPVVYTALNGEMPVTDHSLEKDIPPGITVLKTPIWEPYDLYKKFIGRKKEDKINASFLNEDKKTGWTEKLSIWIRGNFFIPDARRFWVKPSIHFLEQYIQQNGIKLIVSSGPPHSMHLIALGLKKNNPALKWIADFRDPWTNIDFYSKLMLTPMADRKHHRQEMQVLKSCDLVLSIGNSMSEEFKSMFKNAGGTDLAKFHVITNGYDETDISKVEVELDPFFTIAHIGTLVKDRNPEVLWKVLSGMIKVKPEFAQRLRIKLVGKVDLFVKERLGFYGLSGFVQKIDYLPHDEVIVEQQRSHVLLLLVNQTKNAKGILTGKFFEYMASGRPVLAIGPEHGDLAAIMRETECGLISGFEDEKQLEKNILALFSNNVQVRGNEKVKLYSRRALTARLCELFSLLR